MALRCSGMKGAEAGAVGKARCRGGAARAWVQGSYSSSGAVQRRARPGASGWTAGPCVSGPVRCLVGCSCSPLWGLQQRSTSSFGRAVPSVFLTSPHTCRVQTSLFRF